MADFLNPFSGMVPRKMTKYELIRALRLNIAAEQEAAHLYTAHADATDDPLAKEVLLDIAREERVHVGEFMKLLSILEPDEDAALAEGAEEVQEMAEALGKGGSAGGAEGAEAATEGQRGEDAPSVGSLKG